MSKLKAAPRERISLGTMVAFIFGATEKWDREIFTAKDIRDVSVKGRAIEEAISQGGFGCRTPHVLKLMSILLGETLIDIRPGKLGFYPLTMVVPTGCDNGHNYPTGKPALYTGFSRCGRSLSSVEDVFFKWGIPAGGNHMTQSKRHLRPATKAEIRSFLKQSPRWVHDHIKYVIMKKCHADDED